MKTANLQPSHATDIVRGRANPHRATARGITTRDASTDVEPVTDILFIGATVTDGDDGTAIVTIGGEAGTPETGDASSLLGIPIQVWSGALSQPPTESELEAILGSPADAGGITFIVHSTTSGYYYTVASAGPLYYVTPLARPTGTSGGGGGGSSPAAIVLTTAPAGGWSWFEDPRALAHGTYTYVGYNQGGTLKVAAITAGAVVNTVTIASGFEYDDHDTPTFYYEPINDKLVVWYSRHLGPNIYKRVSSATLTSDPSLAGGFAAAVDYASTFEASADRFITYPSPLYTSNADGLGDDHMWVFYRAHVNGTDAEWHYTASTDGGVTWPGLSTHLHSITYSKVVSDGVGTIHMACSEYPPESDATKIYHLYRQSGAWHKSDGTGMGVGVPFDGTDMTTVYSTGGDKVWIWDIALDGTGKPYITFVRFVSTSDHRAYYARWTGSAWDVHEIVATGGTIADDLSFNADQVYYAGGVVLDHDDPTIVYLAKVVSGQFEMFKYVTADGGTSWSSTALTTSSSVKNFRPVGVQSQADLAMVWLDGTYEHYSNYSDGIKAYQP